MKKLKKLHFSNTEFADRFRTLMGKRNLTLADIASATGNAVSTVSTWRRGRCPKKLTSIRKLAKVMQVSHEYLISGVPCENEYIFSNEKEMEFFQKKDPEILKIEAYMQNLIRKNSRRPGELSKLYERLKKHFGNSLEECEKTSLKNDKAKSKPKRRLKDGNRCKKTQKSAI